MNNKPLYISNCIELLMSAKEVGKKIGEFIADRRVEIAGLTVTGVTVASASAALDINATVGPILDSVTELIPTLITLIVAIVPASSVCVASAAY
jgi:hypothetical protein